MYHLTLSDEIFSCF